MARKRKTNALDIYVGQSKVGLYTREVTGATSFRYDEKWLNDKKKAFPISLSMPLSDKVWKGEECSAYFDGLLPDLQNIRETIAAREEAESAKTFDLLAAIGRDCVGALRFIPEGEDPGDPTEMKSRSLTKKEIDARLNKLGSSPLGMFDDEDDFRISLAGAQEKTAFLKEKGEWRLPLEATPTSHIFKPSMGKRKVDGVDLSDSPWNEWICLELCKEYGMEAANSEVLKFDKKEVIIVERFDREWQRNILYRLPQEDLCQAMAISPTKKYQSDGGPRIIDVLEFLNSGLTPHEDRLKFFKAQILFWLFAAVDGHAKNFSIFLTPGGFKLTPLYDVMSIAPYKKIQIQKAKMAMSVGSKNHYKVVEIVPRHFYQTAQKAGIKKEDVDQLIDQILKATDSALSNVGQRASKTAAPKKTFDLIAKGIVSRAKLLS